MKKRSQRKYVSSRKGRLAKCLGDARKRARRRGQEFGLDRKWLSERFTRCSVTGIEFSYEPNSPFLPSIDRIDNSRGYTRDNCRVVCWIYNCARGRFTDEDVLKMASCLLSRNYDRVNGVSS